MHVDTKTSRSKTKPVLKFFKAEEEALIEHADSADGVHTYEWHLIATDAVTWDGAVEHVIGRSYRPGQPDVEVGAGLADRGDGWITTSQIIAKVGEHGQSIRPPWRVVVIEKNDPIVVVGIAKYMSHSQCDAACRANVLTSVDVLDTGTVRHDSACRPARIVVDHSQGVQAATLIIEDLERVL
jgi:hypothetical protein